MKKSNFKCKLFFTVLLLFSLLGLKAQWCVTQKASTNANQSSGQPSTCVRQLLNDMVPTTNDPTLEVNVNFWVFAPIYMSSLTAVWTHSANPTTSVDAQHCLDIANATFSNIPATPQLQVPNLTVGTSYAKIKLVLKNFTIVNADAPYISVGNAAAGNLGFNWHDPTAINIFVGTETYTSIAAGSSGTYIASQFATGAGIGAASTPALPGVANVVYLNPIFHYTLLPDGSRYDNVSAYGGVVAHETGHMLGLQHPNGPTSTYSACCNWEDLYSNISPSFGCCNYQECNDYVKEIYPCTSNIPIQCKPLIPFTGCDTPGESDNLMSDNSGCGRYLSPQQIGVMQYNLRTILKGFLTSSSYSAAVNIDPAYNYNVTSNETWNTDRYIRGNIYVKSNKTLIINCGVAMTRYSKIIVEQGGQLIIDGGTITNISGELWDGIYLIGNPFQPQLTPHPTNTGAVLYQGMLRVKNGGTISQAVIGVRNYLNSTGNSGGIIFASNANFLNNVIDVQMSGQYMVNQTPIASASWFYNCNFNTTGVIGHGVSATNHVYLLNVLGVKFRACNFINSGVGPLPGNGIYSIDATYSLDQNGLNSCVFQDLEKGIYVNNINPLRIPVIAHTQFINNVNAIYFKNANNLVLQTNTFVGISFSGSKQVYLDNCKYYKVKNNEFSFNTLYSPSAVGVSAYKSKTGAHEIYRNNFSNLFMAINCMDDNGNPNSATDGLKMNCNDFHATPNSYDVVLSHTAGLAMPLVNRTQGNVGVFATATQLVRNIYGANCGNENKWQIYSGSTVTINHGANTNTVTSVTQPTATGCKSSYLNVVDQNITLDYPVDCSLYPSSSGGTSTISSNRLGVMNEYIGDLMLQRANDIAAAVTPDDFELQATVASKINLFLTDSVLVNADSVITLLQTNQGFMEDADIQTVFAYMNKGDYATAQDLASQLDVETRADWKNLLTTLISFQLDSIYGMDSILTSYSSLFSTYAESSDMDGKSIAQSALMAALVGVYEGPNALPENEVGSRMMNQSSQQGIGNAAVNQIHVYPNPTNSGINVNYNFEEDFSVKIELKDLLGKVIYTNFTSSRLIEQFISLSDLKSGMYLLSLTKDKELIYTTKIVKVD